MNQSLWLSFTKNGEWRLNCKFVALFEIISPLLENNCVHTGVGTIVKVVIYTETVICYLHYLFSNALIIFYQFNWRFTTYKST